MHVCVWLFYALEEYPEYEFREVQKCNCGKIRVIPVSPFEP